MNALPALQQIHNEVMSQRMADQLKMVLPPHISIEKFQRVVITAINKNAQLVEADRLSLLNACVECATDGLLPNGKEAALVIFNSKNRVTQSWEKKVQYMPMVAGIYKKAHNSGEFKVFRAEVVHKNDEFSYETGFEVNLTHKPALDDPGEITHVYSAVIMQDGTRDLEVMRFKEIEDVRATSKASDDGPWSGAFWGEMAKKTVIRRHAKRLPLSTELERVIHNVDQYYGEGAEPVQVITGPIPPRPTRGSEEEAARMKAEIEADEPKDFVIYAANGEEHTTGLGPRAYVNELNDSIKRVFEMEQNIYQQFYQNNIDMVMELRKMPVFQEKGQALLDDMESYLKRIPAAEAPSASPPPDAAEPPQVDQPENVPAGGEIRMENGSTIKLEGKGEDQFVSIDHPTFKWTVIGGKEIEVTDPEDWAKKVITQLNHHLVKRKSIEACWTNNHNVFVLSDMKKLGGKWAEASEKVKAAFEEKLG